MCSHSAAHTRHCLAENIHPSLSGENQNVSHFPDHSNHLIFPGQHFWTEGPGHWRWAEATEQALQQTPQVLKHSHHQTLKGLQLLLSKSAFSSRKSTGADKHGLLERLHYNLFSFVSGFFGVFLFLNSSFSWANWGTKNQPIIVPTVMQLWEAICHWTGCSKGAWRTHK